MFFDHCVQKITLLYNIGKQSCFLRPPSFQLSFARRRTQVAFENCTLTEAKNNAHARSLSPCTVEVVSRFSLSHHLSKRSSHMSLSCGCGVRLRPRLVSLAPLAFLNAGPNSPTIGMDTGNESLCFFEFLVIVRTPPLFLILTHWSKRQLDDGVCHRGYFGVNEA